MLIKVENKWCQDCLSKFRDERNQPYAVRKYVENITYVLASEVSNYIKNEAVRVKTPLGEACGHVMNEEIELVPVLRAGLAMLQPFVEMNPSAHIGFIACSRGHDLNVTVAYERISKSLTNKTVIILDPALATGHTIEKVLDVVESRGAQKVIIVSIMYADRGIKYLENRCNYPIFSLNNREELNEQYYLTPGVGDAGDRLYGSVE